MPCSPNPYIMPARERCDQRRSADLPAAKAGRRSSVSQRSSGSVRGPASTVGP
jgi:hypothetical protein